MWIGHIWALVNALQPAYYEYITMRKQLQMFLEEIHTPATQTALTVEPSTGSTATFEYPHHQYVSLL